MSEWQKSVVFRTFSYLGNGMNFKDIALLKNTNIQGDPFLTSNMTPQQQHGAIQQMIKTTNKYMKRICSELEIPMATTYVARHSFATVLKRSSASVEYISESLGHKSIPTTQNYLADFEIDEKRKWAAKLGDFEGK